MCVKLPDNVDTMEGGFMESLAAGLHNVTGRQKIRACGKTVKGAAYHQDMPLLLITH